MQVRKLPETRIVLENVRWDTYIELSEQRRGSIPRMVYDKGLLEMMNPKHQHENIGCLIARLVETYTEVKGIEIHSVASTTFRRQDVLKAFEADKAYYVTHADLIRLKEEIELLTDPPPDLVIEVEITKSAIRKLKLFATMGVPEVWRYHGKRLKMLRLNVGVYSLITGSEEIPGLTAAMIDTFVGKRFEIGETKLIREFRQSLMSR